MLVIGVGCIKLCLAGGLNQTAGPLSKRRFPVSQGLGTLGAAAFAAVQGDQPALLDVEPAFRYQFPLVEAVAAQGVAPVLVRRLRAFEG